MSEQNSTKLHIGCSLTAYQVIMEDYGRFNPGHHPLSRDAFLNKVLLQSHDDEYVQRKLNDFSLNPEILQADGRTEDDVTDKGKYPDPFGLLAGRVKANASFNLYDDVRSALYPDNDLESNKRSRFRSVGSYVNVLFEIYGSLSYLFREKILLCGTLQALEYCISIGGTVHAQTISVNADLTRKYINHVFIPYTIRSDSMGMYHYIIGLDIDGITRKADMRPVSFRIINLRNVRISADAPFDIYGLDIMLENQIEQVGAEYIGNRAVTATVIMNSQGLDQYKKKLTGRPHMEILENYKYAPDNTYRVYKCIGSEKQIRTYFNYTFGSGAVVLSPKYLRDEIVNDMESMADAYTRMKPENGITK